MGVDNSNIVQTTAGTDPVTGDYVVVVDGVEISRTPQPEAKNSIDINTYLSDTHIPNMRILKANADTDITTAQAVKAAAQAVKNLPITTVAQANIAIDDLTNVVIDLTNLLIDAERRFKDLATGEIKTGRKLLGEFDGQD